jgi:hypothetical protein
LHVNRNRWIELKRTIEWAELAARPSLADQFFAGAAHVPIGSLGQL